MFEKNPDPDANHMLRDSITGLKLLLTNKLPSRYQIMKEGGASDNSIKQMRFLVAGLFAVGFIEGILTSLLVFLIFTGIMRA